MNDARRTEAELRWRASPLARAIATCAGVVLVAAVIGSRWQLIAFVAPLLGVLISIGWQRSVPKVYVHAEPALQRCFEGEQTQLSVWATAEPADVAVAVVVSGVAGMRIEATDAEPVGRQTITVEADRWGRYPIRASVDVVAPGGLLSGTATVDAADVFVFPLAPPQSTAIPKTELLDRLGTHLTRHIGPGVEYADIRPYVPGDHMRTVNWPVSARRGSLHITQRLTDRAADVVVLIDMYAQPPGPATEATERALRGAVQVVQSALRSGDRAGLVALGGGRPRWLAADIGRRQFYRVLDTLLGAGDEFESTTGTLAPGAALPPGAIVVAFSTMLDTQFALSLIDLRKRGHTVVAVDVLEGAPFVGHTADPLFTRMWALQRSFMYRDMGTIGVDIVSWPSQNTLDQAMRLVPERRRPVRGRR
ncbi:ATPase [Mycobacteriaceae bacterium 1482268.1]|nr:ATPase [Mycobacteriaceae bacterium 1482268.1]